MECFDVLTDTCLGNKATIDSSTSTPELGGRSNETPGEALEVLKAVWRAAFLAEAAEAVVN